MSSSAIPCPHCGLLVVLEAQPLPLRQWGVYQLLDSTGRVIYVGMTGTPRRRLRSHLRELGDRVAQILWDAVDSRVAAFDLESQLIAQHRPPMNIQKVQD